MISESVPRTPVPSPLVGGTEPVAARSPPLAGAVEWETIGLSGEGRPIVARLLRAPSDRPRLVIVAGQHGDEAAGRAAVAEWVERTVASFRESGDAPPVGIAAVVEANPDGAARRRRSNAAGVDLNRDHYRLMAPETRALHGLVRRFRPHFLVDVHNYPARRRHLLAQGWTIGADVQIAPPTHPAIRTSLGPEEWADLLASVFAHLGARGYSATPYTLLGRSGRARPSTLRTRDARNAIALRYGIPTLLLEGRDLGRDRTESTMARTVAAQIAALEAVAAWAGTHAEVLVRGPPLPQPGEVVPLGARWTETGSPTTVLLQRAAEGPTEAVRWDRYASSLEVRRTVPLPRAYAVRADLLATLELLERQDLVGEPITTSRFALVTPTVGKDDDPAAPGRPTAPTDVQGYVAYSVHQRGGRALAVWLERRSRSRALQREREASGADRTSGLPILRIDRWDYRPPTEAGPVAPFGILREGVAAVDPFPGTTRSREVP